MRSSIAPPFVSFFLAGVIRAPGFRLVKSRRMTAAVTTLLLIRHAANDYLGRAVAGRLPGVHLNAAGRAQAERLAERLAGHRIDRLYSSPLERAQETAQPLTRRLGLEVQTAPEVTEIDFGEWAGRTLAELADLPLWHRFNTYRSGSRAPGGERMLDVQVRLVTFLQRLHAEAAGQTVAVVSHSDPIKAALCYYLGISLDLAPRLEIEPASVTGLALADHGPRVLYINRGES
jgi:probable phosphoglycerate mutase